MNRKCRIIAIVLTILMVFESNNIGVQAREMNPANYDAEDISSEIDSSEFEIAKFSEGESDIFDNSQKRPIIERTRSAALLADNPNTRVSGSLTTSDTQALYFFSITGTSRFMLARLLSANTNYVAQLFVYD